jgi:hypothetical protein
MYTKYSNVSASFGIPARGTNAPEERCLHTPQIAPWIPRLQSGLFWFTPKTGDFWAVKAHLQSGTVELHAKSKIAILENLNVVWVVDDDDPDP